MSLEKTSDPGAVCALHDLQCADQSPYPTAEPSGFDIWAGHHINRPEYGARMGQYQHRVVVAYRGQFRTGKCYRLKRRACSSRRAELQHQRERAELDERERF
uniref:Uncharacterized protein n=1 Tax=blood disease bacterium R229 TaxID=741978 RepID=G2ZK61_9RALS|nr:hypothetical protein BDB_60031 [blood disease bacterium R229]